MRQNGLLEGELSFVAGVLVLASAAGSEVLAGGGNALWRDGDDLLGLGGRIAALVLGDADARLLAGQREWNEDGFAFDAGEKGAAVDGLGDVDELRFGRGRVSCCGRWKLQRRD
jgi:hypothetical protein